MDSLAGDTNSSHGETIVDIEPRPRPAKWRPECCIYKVPKRLRNVRKEAYTPKLISIGPVHRQNDELKDMESLKERYFKEFFDRNWKDKKDFEKIVEDNVDKIRHCYAEEIFKEDEIKKDEKDFKHMILQDSIFVIELFWRTFYHRGEDDKDYILSKPSLEDGIKQDLILLENQLPFFIFDELYQYHAMSKDIQNSFLMLACNYFFGGDKKISIEKEVKYFTDLQKEKEVKHFTDLLRYFYCPRNLNTGPTIEHLRSATKLDEAGLKFLKWEEDTESERRRLLDIQIKKRCSCMNWLLHCLPCACLCLKRMRTCFVVPRFVVDYKTEDLFRNLMALEQCHYPFETYICNYIVLLDFLIDTKEDVELLVQKKIIVNWLGSNKAVAIMVNHEIATKLNGHYDNCWNHNMASLKTIYFRDIWRGTATVVGIIVLLVTVGNFLRPFLMKK
jgi:hypothetical protein